MEYEELHKVIKQGESQTLEFKRDFTPEIGKTICAFANTNEGVVLVGISDDGEIVGVADDIESRVAQVAHSCKPSIYPEIDKILHDGKIVLIVTVPLSKGVLHSFKNVAYKRVGTSDMPMSPDEVITFAKQARVLRYDNQACEAERSDIDDEAVKEFTKSAISQRRLDVAASLPVEEALEKLELKIENNLSYAAVLLFGKEPQRFVLQSEVRCARFKGKDTLRFLDMKVLRGNVIEQIDNAEKFVMNHIRLEAEVRNFLREEKWEYPLSAVREAITNAICHRDYFSTANVHVSIFDDRLEVWNPGSLPPELTIDDLKRPHKSIPRNPLIANVLFFIKYIERWGTGTERIIKDTLAHNLPEPEFNSTSGGFEVVFRKAEAFLEGLNERQKKAWEYLRGAHTITRTVYSKLCECSTTTSFNDLQDMVKKGLLQKIGKGKATTYKRIL
jgi:ATP-dependent DNA helicase RecG